MELLAYLLVNTFAIGVASYLLPGVYVESLLTAVVLAIVLGIINTFLKPILVLLTLPITVVTLGIFLLILNGLIILLASEIVPGFRVENFWSAIVFSIVISLVSWFLNLFLKPASSPSE